MDIKQLFSEAWSALLAQNQKLRKTLPVPILILVALNIAYEYQNGGLFVRIFIIAAGVFVQSALAVSVHRIILLSQDSVPDFILLPDRRIFLFLGYSIAFGLLMLPFALLVMLIPIVPVAIFLYLLILAYSLGRLSLTFPSIAIDSSWRFRESWNATEAFQWTMFVVIGTFGVLLILPEFFLEDRVYIATLFGIISLIIGVYFVAVLSITYKKIRERL